MPKSEGAAERGPGAIRVRELADSIEFSIPVYRSGDFVHFVICPPVFVLASLFLWIGVDRGTLFDTCWLFPAILVVFLWAWNTLTLACNTRYVRIGPEGLLVRERPLPGLGSRLDVALANIREFTVQESRKSTDSGDLVLHHVALRAQGRKKLNLFENLATEAEAKFVARRLAERLSALLG